jgi:hypothetical protein
VTSLLAHSVRLTLVLVHAGVHEADNIGANAGLEDGRKGNRPDDLAGLGVDGNKGTCCLQGSPTCS